MKLLPVANLPASRRDAALERIRNILVFAENPDQVEVCDPDLAPGGADAVDLIYQVLDEFGLMPTPFTVK